MRNISKQTIFKIGATLIAGIALGMNLTVYQFEKELPTRVENITNWVKKYEPKPSCFNPDITDRQFWKKHPATNLQQIPPTIQTNHIQDFEGPELAKIIRQGVEQELTFNTGEWIPTVELRLKQVIDAPWSQTTEMLDLHASEVGATLAWAITMLKPKLNPVLIEQVEITLRRKITGPFLKDFEKSQLEPLIWTRDMCPWIGKKDNWSAVCTNNVIFVALAIEPSPKTRAEFIHRAEDVMENYMESIEEDGYINAGVRYWNYGFGHFMLINERIAKATGGNILLANHPKMRKLAEFKQKILVAKFGKQEFTPPFADNQNPTSENTWLENLNHLRFGTPAPEDPIQSDQENIPISAKDVTIQTEKKIKPGKPSQLPTESTKFESLGVLISRNPHNKTVFVIQGGKNFGEHNHNDLGSYALFQNQNQITGDWGSETYETSHYSGERYEFPLLGSFGHPVPVVDNHLQVIGGPDRIARILKLEITPEKDTAEYDLSPGYGTPGLKTLIRTAVIDKTKPETLITITDKFEADYPIKFETAVIHGQGRKTKKGIETKEFEIKFSSEASFDVTHSTFWKEKELVKRTNAELAIKSKTGSITTTIRSKPKLPANP